MEGKFEAIRQLRAFHWEWILRDRVLNAVATCDDHDYLNLEGNFLISTQSNPSLYHEIIECSHCGSRSERRQHLRRIYIVRRMDNYEVMQVSWHVPVFCDYRYFHLDNICYGCVAEITAFLADHKKGTFERSAVQRHFPAGVADVILDYCDLFCIRGCESCRTDGDVLQ